jgi:hypothetical protein
MTQTLFLAKWTDSVAKEFCNAEEKGEALEALAFPISDVRRGAEIFDRA